jgi:hypothetical protein
LNGTNAYENTVGKGINDIGEGIKRIKHDTHLPKRTEIVTIGSVGINEDIIDIGGV